MAKVITYSALLLAGLVGAQLLALLAPGVHGSFSEPVKLLTMACLSFIMIHVGYEFDIDKSALRAYGWDYVVAATAAAFPWIFAAAYFVFALLPAESWSSWPAWKEALLIGRFASPTSAGVLFAMLAAAGLAGTWVFRKARILAIFDDIDTILFMVPLKMMMVGVRWQLGVLVFVMAGMLWAGWRYLHTWRLPPTWPWVMAYAAGITAVCEMIFLGSKLIDDVVPIHLEVLLPSFILGCVIARVSGQDPHGHDTLEGHEIGLESPQEQQVATLVSGTFMVLVGLSMPPIATLMASTPGGATWPGWGALAVHVVLVTILSNLGKMYPALCYRGEASPRERLALAIAMFPRGEVGAGVLVVSLTYGVGGVALMVGTLSLALNLLFTGVIVAVVKRLAH
jgi:hypothetical protein